MLGYLYFVTAEEASHDVLGGHARGVSAVSLRDLGICMVKHDLAMIGPIGHFFRQGGG